MSLLSLIEAATRGMMTRGCFSLIILNSIASLLPRMSEPRTTNEIIMENQRQT